MVALFVVLAGCGGTEVVADPSPEAVAAVAVSLDATPTEVERVLAEHGWTVDTFEARLFEIAADPALTDAYLSAR